MTDLLKLLILNDTEYITYLYNHELLKEYQTTTKTKNELGIDFLYYNQIKEYNGVYFMFYSNDKQEVFTKCEILMKPHYYFNDNIHNANDFTAIDSINVLTTFAELFKLPLSEIKVLNIEYGTNFLSHIKATDVITYATHQNKNIFITTSDNLRYSKISFKPNKRGQANKYKRSKFYAKGIQFPEYTDIDTLRYEIKSKETKYIKTQLNIHTYTDLLKQETYLTFAEKLLQEFKEVLILDADNIGNNLTPKEMIKLSKFNNPLFWEKKLQESKNSFNQNKKRYNILLNKTGTNLHQELTKTLEIKLTQLTKECAVSTTIEQQKECAYSTVYINGNGTNNNNYKCMVTNLDISMQNADSKMISTKGIKHYYDTNRKTFDLLVNKYLSNKWINSDVDKKIFEIYHNIRNTKSNSLIRQNRLYPKNQIQLF